MNTNDTTIETILSFNQLINASFINISFSNFERIDTGEYLGSIWAKYPKHSKISATAYGGIIEFQRPNEKKCKKIYGIELKDINAKIFRGYN